MANYIVALLRQDWADDGWDDIEVRSFEDCAKALIFARNVQANTARWQAQIAQWNGAVEAEYQRLLKERHLPHKRPSEIGAEPQYGSAWAEACALHDRQDYAEADLVDVKVFESGPDACREITEELA